MIIKNKAKALRHFNKLLRGKRHSQNRANRYIKSHRSPEQQQEHDTRIIHITAKRFNVPKGQQFPLEAIILMADKGVVEAKKQYNKLAKTAQQLNMSVRKVYDMYVLGKYHGPT